MPKSCVGLLTYNRRPVLETSLSKVIQYVEPDTRIAVFEDAGYYDDTESFLTGNRSQVEPTEFTRTTETIEWVNPVEKHEVFMGDRNLGVAGNSNRAIHWFMTQTDADHLCLCNDDILPQGDFVSIYRKAHERLGIGHFSLMPFDTSETYKPNFVHYRGMKIKLCPRMTGIMMSFTRECLEDVGYFDMSFGPFGQEHCDLTNRCRFMGQINIDGQPQGQVDIVQDCVSFQHVGSSMAGQALVNATEQADSVMRNVSKRYRLEGCYRPFATERPKVVGAHSGAGIPYPILEPNFTLVTDRMGLSF